MTSESPDFGTHHPDATQRFVLSITRRLPAGWLPKRIGFLLRKIVMRSLRTPLDVPVYGSQMRLHPHDNLCEKRVLFMPQHYESRERQALSERFREGFTFLDIGANVGTYSLFVASEVGPTAQVVAVEPSPKMLNRLRFNLEASKLKQVAVEPLAVADQPGTMSLYINPDNAGQSSLTEEGQSDSVEVRCTTLLELMDQHDMQTVDAAKLDVEGAELDVLTAFFAEAPPQRHPRLLIIECFAKQPLNDAVKLALNHGYKLHTRTRMNAILAL